MQKAWSLPVDDEETLANGQAHAPYVIKVTTYIDLSEFHWDKSRDVANDNA